MRIKELFESYRVIREILDQLPPGDLTVQGEAAGSRPARRSAASKRRAASCSTTSKSAGATNPDRVKVRTPSLCNWASVLVTAPGHKLADVPMLLAGIDPCFSCNDRLVTIRAARQRGDLDLGAPAPIRNRVLPMNITLPPLVALLFFPGGLFLLFGGLVYECADRKLVAQFQNRIGPALVPAAGRHRQAAGQGGDRPGRRQPAASSTGCRSWRWSAR